MIKVALTGNIASGKSCVQVILEHLGYKVFDADMCSHKLLESSSEVLKAFGTNAREELAALVFSDKKKLCMLEEILHPLIKEKMFEFFDANSADDIVFAAVPLLFEAGFDKFFDKIVFVSAPYDMRLERLIKRNNYAKDYAKLRLDSQQDELEKIKKSDFVIVNDSDTKALEKKTKECLEFLL